MKPKKKIIGRRENVSFPGLDLINIDAKIDTGAYTSSIHCKDVTATEKDGQLQVTFTVLDEQHPQFSEKPITCPVSRIRSVKNSFGQAEDRYCIITTIAIYNQQYDIELSLADRSLMDYPMLLGRKAIRKRFLVDVSKLNCAQQITKPKKKQTK
ncbi:MAG: ATP-dependent zinc protease [Sphingobacteriales bacterium]|nr:MAG: ATP-dependent zinc protease [Sphingobacteriales bacterium]